MNDTYECYEIDTYDIWEYERFLFLHKEGSERHAKKVLAKLHTTIASLSSPEASKSDNRFQQTLKKLEYFEAKLKGIQGLYKIDFFIYNKCVFRYDQNIVIGYTNENFEYCFSLKLRQYHDKTSYLNGFLDFQLVENFDNNLDEFCGFLRLNMKRYKSELYTKDLIAAVSSWINSQTSHGITLSLEQEAVKNGVSRKNTKHRGLKIHTEIQEAVVRALQPFFEEKDHKLLHKLIKGEEITSKIYFQSNANRFVVVFRQLHLHQKVIDNYVHTNEWICTFFQYKNNRKGKSDFAQSDVHKILTAGSYDIPKEKRINILDLDFIKEKSKNR